MERKILVDLCKWKDSKRRKPLILRGARQVGKTWILQEFGKRYFSNCIYVNFERQAEYKQFFQTTKDVHRILQNLSLASGKKITTDTLIIFDEIQACEEALNTLKYFCEEAPEYYVASAGSLLGLKLSQGFPVGKVDFLEMSAMSFEEFLLANGDESLLNYLDNIEEITTIPDAFFNPLVEKLKMYFITGGMPEAVLVWTQDRDIVSADNVLSDILLSYESDFGKHADKFDVYKIGLIWDSLPSQLAKQNKKFLYSAIKEGCRAREYENALKWLYSADMVKKVYRISKPGLPLSAYDDLTAFKIYMGDVGLLRKHSHLAISAFTENNRLFTEFKGALTENYVLQCISRLFEVKPRYWTNLQYEVDFIIQRENEIIPLEVKAGENVKSTSLKNYYKAYEKETPILVRISLNNLSLDGNILNIPLFLVDKLDKLIGIALKIKSHSN
ncbi:MAG: AAA family ATPase [Anaeroplasmataceae bacterium]|nr:AAA family ATPase [Anaeroplasmataceae bacterium]